MRNINGFAILELIFAIAIALAISLAVIKINVELDKKANAVLLETKELILEWNNIAKAAARSR